MEIRSRFFRAPLPDGARGGTLRLSRGEGTDTRLVAGWKAHRVHQFTGIQCGASSTFQRMMALPFIAKGDRCAGNPNILAGNAPGRMKPASQPVQWLELNRKLTPVNIALADYQRVDEVGLSPDGQRFFSQYFRISPEQTGNNGPAAISGKFCHRR
jgi:hypothetical protein